MRSLDPGKPSSCRLSMGEGSEAPSDANGGKCRPIPTLSGVIFDLDGTLVDSGLDFAAMRREMGLGSEPILEALELLSLERRRDCEAILSRHEQAGAERATLLHGALDWLEFLDERRIPRAIFTRNARSSAALSLARCGVVFEHIVAREDGPPKPDPAGIHRLCQEWGMSPGAVLVVGDYLYDLLAGRAAGSPTALVTCGRTWEFANLADHVWPSLAVGLSEAKQWNWK